MLLSWGLSTYPPPPTPCASSPARGRDSALHRMPPSLTRDPFWGHTIAFYTGTGSNVSVLGFGCGTLKGGCGRFCCLCLRELAGAALAPRMPRRAVSGKERRPIQDRERLSSPTVAAKSSRWCGDFNKPPSSRRVTPSAAGYGELPGTGGAALLGLLLRPRGPSVLPPNVLGGLGPLWAGSGLTPGSFQPHAGSDPEDTLRTFCAGRGGGGATGGSPHPLQPPSCQDSRTCLRIWAAMVWLQSKMMRNSRPRFISLSRGRESSESRGSWRIFRRMLYLDGAMMSSCSRMSPGRPRGAKDTRVHTGRHSRRPAQARVCTQVCGHRHGCVAHCVGCMCRDTATWVQTWARGHSGTALCTRLYTPAHVHTHTHTHIYVGMHVDMDVHLGLFTHADQGVCTQIHIHHTESPVGTDG